MQQEESQNTKEGFIERYFKLKSKQSNIKTELMAGFTIFLSMLYVIPVSSEILSHAGMPKDALITAITLVTILSTLACGLYANTPVAMSVGMGLNAYFTYGIVQGIGISWQQALGIVFISGVVFIIVSFSNFRIWILKSIPKNLRFALCVGLGAFLATIGLKGLGFFVLQNGNLLLGNLSEISTLLGTLGILLILVLYLLKVQGAFILGIIILSLLGFFFGISPLPTQILSSPASLAPLAFELEILSVLKFAFIPIILTLMVTDLFDSLGTLSGIGTKANLFVALEDNSTKKDKALEKTLQVDAVATTMGSLFGVSTTTSFLESASGVAMGGRSGLSAIFTALFFCLTLFMLPLFLSIPSFAIYPVLVVVGVAMFLEIARIDFSDSASAVASFFVILLMPLTTSITIGLSAGFLVCLLILIIQRQWQKINFGLIFIAFLSLLPFIL
ncbi:NCS2 family permease [Helicobacter sp. MIT 11-5569]|uniref:NCS2 family permease n=1 Tax=Helicobacter sp. MIT 11-5569 TaxID=1548151 RepID=UPI00069257A4|nr:NCS2 family permease [Helicobacter sp. MIT 11-5569]TLD83882.1 NCS2 family permease [Helicobacter sp. MIT 11-5569]